MSTLRVNNVNEVGGDSVITAGILDSGSLPGGSILQIVNDNTTTISTITAASFTDTTLSATITPISTSSTIVVLGQACVLTETSPVESRFTVFRNGASSGINLGNGAQGLGRLSLPNGYNSVAISAYDFPATTNATTYTFALSLTSGIQARLSPNGQKSTITLLEVAA